MAGLLEAAMKARHEEQLERPSDDPQRDPWAICGPVRCRTCGDEIGRMNRLEGSGADAGYSLTNECRACWLKRCRSHRPCLVEGCKRRARANGRCRVHLHGDPEFYGWNRGPKWHRRRLGPLSGGS